MYFPVLYSKSLLLICFIVCMCVCVSVTQLCLTLCDPMDCSLPGFSIHGILQTRIQEWVASLSSRGSSQPRDWTQVSHIAGRFFTVWATREDLYIVVCICSSQSPHLSSTPWNIVQWASLWMTKAGSSEMHSREDSVLHRWSTEGLLHLPDMRAHPERTWATSQREPQQWGESPGPALLLSGTRSLIIPWTVERSSLDQDHHQWESTWFTWLSEKHLLSHTQVLRNKHITCHREGFLGGSVGKEFACNAGDHLQCRRPDFDPWVGKIFWRRKWQPTPVLLPGESHGQGRLVGDGL